LARPRICLVAALIGSVVLGFFQGQIDPYFVDILSHIGINITLAVSLNLINGHTGQFSLGHAGFMAVGAYTAAAMTLFAGPHVLPATAGPVLPMLWFLLALLAGGLIAALAGLLVGAPSLRLKGDYLAIVTLGFNQIIIVILQNMESVGGARGFSGLPQYTNFLWTFGVA